MDRSVLAIASTARGLIIGGDFREIDGESIRAVARHDAVDGWVDVEGSPSARVGALLPRLGSVWMGGDFLGTADGSSEGVIVWHPILATDVDGPVTPQDFHVEAIPNPFNPRTEIRFDLPRAGRVVVDVFDVAGRHVRRLLDDVRTADTHRAVWNGRDADGHGVASGVYHVVVRGADVRSYAKLTLVR
jgi:hypothetical protein